MMEKQIALCMARLVLHLELKAFSQHLLRAPLEKIVSKFLRYMFGGLRFDPRGDEGLEDIWGDWDTEGLHTRSDLNDLQIAVKDGWIV
jgi:hypothetical protein